MSGGGSGDYYFPRPNTKSVSCARLVVITTLVRVEEAVIPLLKVGEALMVQEVGGALAVYYGDQLVGEVETPQNRQLMDCILAGTVYIAEIIELEGVQCKVRISATSL